MLGGERSKYLLVVLVMLCFGSAGITGGLLLAGTIGGIRIWSMLIIELGIGLWAMVSRVQQMMLNSARLRKSIE